MHNLEENAEVPIEAFRQELFSEGILHNGDTIGTDDETLLYARPPLQPVLLSAFLSYRRFLRARKFDLEKTKKMIRDCQEWRRTVEGVGIDELYRRVDPFDVSDFCSFRMCPEGTVVSRARGCICLLAHVVPQSSSYAP